MMFLIFCWDSECCITTLWWLDAAAPVLPGGYFQDREFQAADLNILE